MIGEKLGPFLIEEKLGSGAMGVVYRATWDVNSQAVAIKVIHQDQATKSNSTERFTRESDILKQFRHPNIVRHIGVGFSRVRGLRYYAMEYVPGTTLEQVLNDRGALPWTEVVALGIQIAEALQYAHERGVVHRDLKPSNLMITQRGQVKLTDFGIAKDLDRTALTADGRTLGTAAYMAPEQIRGTPEISHKTDLYALGCLFYQMLTGRTPFEGKSAMVLMHKHLDEPPPRPSARNPEIPLALDKLVVQLMAKDRDDRPWDATAVLHALTELRDKQARSEPVAMVFGNAGANPTRLGTAGPTGTSAPPATEAATRARKAARGSRRGGVRSLPGHVREHPDLVGMVAALVGVLALIAYLLWPPSAAYLHQKAGVLMDSPTRADWIYARDYYMAELDRRFPGHAYAEDVRGWRDRILLGNVERRARVLESPALTGLTETQNSVEADYLRAYRLAVADREQGAYELAMNRWNELAALLDPEIEEERGWYLHVKNQAAEFEQAIQQRRRNVQALIDEAAQAYGSGRYDRAIQIREQIVRNFQAFPDLSDLIAQVMAQRENVVAPPLPPDPSAPAGAGVAGFENTPEGACRALFLARDTGDIIALRRVTTPAPEPMLALLLTAVPRRIPPGQIDERRRLIENLPLRVLKPGEEVLLPDGVTSYVVTEGDAAEDRAVVAPASLQGLPLRLRKLDGLWRVVPESVLQITDESTAEGDAEADEDDVSPENAPDAPSESSDTGETAPRSGA